MSVPPGVYNVRDYGAVGDGVTDDLPAFQRILDLIANDPTRPVSNRGGGIYVPQGEYFLNGNLLWQDTNVLEGVCYDFFQVHQPCVLKFAAGCGIVVMGSRDPFGHRGDASCIKHLTLFGSKLSVPTYECGHHYDVGDIVTLPHDPRFVYECVQSGTTCARPAPAWQPSHPYSPRARVTPTSINGHSYICITPKASGTGASVTQVGTTATLTGLSGITPLMEGGTVIVSGFATAANNGTFVVTSSTSTSVTYTNSAPGAVTEAGPASWEVGSEAASGASEPVWLWEPKDIVSDGTVKWQREDDLTYGELPWLPSHPYALHETITPTTAIGMSYTCTGAGTSASSQPTFGADTVTDGGVTWTRNPGYLLDFPGTTPMRYGVTATDPSVYWKAKHSYQNGDIIRAPGITSVLFRNDTGTTATSGPSPPSWNTTASGSGASVTQLDTTATFTLSGLSGITNLMVGRAIVVSGFTNTANNGTFIVTSVTSTSVTYKNVAVGAASESGAGSWSTTFGQTTSDGDITWTAVPPDSSLQVDNTVVWAVRCHAGIMADTMIYLDTVGIYNFTGAGVHFRGAGNGYPISNVNYWRMNDVAILQCNGGIYVGGYDCQGGLATGCSVFNGPVDGGEKDYGIWDNGFAGNTWVGCKVEDVAGCPYKALQPGTGASVFLGCYDESAGKPRIQSGIVLGAQLAHASIRSAFTKDSYCHVMSQNGFYGVVAVDYQATGTVKGPLYSYLGQSDGTHTRNLILGALCSGEGAANGLVRTHGHVDAPDGWYMWGYAPDTYGAELAGYAVAGPLATPFRSDSRNGGLAAGSFWLPRGEFYIGPQVETPRCVRFYEAPPADGAWSVGDIIINTKPTGNPTNANNGVFAWHCTTAGMPGTWTPVYLSTRPTPVQVRTGGATTLVSGSDFHFGCTSGGITVNLPASPVMGETFEIKDSNGNAGASPITVSGNGHNIDGSSTYSLSTTYGSITVRYNGTQWSKVFSV